MAVKLKWAKGGFVFRPLYLIPGIFTIYIVHYLDQYGMISLLPQVILGLMGGRWFIKGFYESNNRKFREYQKDQNKKSNRSFLSLFMVFAMFGVIFSGGQVMATDYWDLPQKFTTEQIDDGWKQNVWTYTDNNTIDNGTFELARDYIRYHEGFENIDIGNETPDGWSQLPFGQVDEPCRVDVDDKYAQSGNQSLRIRPPGGGETGSIGHYDFIDGSLLSFWVYFKNAATFTVTTHADYIGSPSFFTVFAYVNFSSTKDIFYNLKSDNGIISIIDTGADYKLGWNKVEIIHDPMNKTYDCWVDDTQIINDARSRDIYQGTYIKEIDTVELLLADNPVWLDDFQIGEDAYFRQGVWQSQYVLTNAWFIWPHPRDDVYLGVSNTTAASGSNSILMQDYNTSDVSTMEHFFKPHDKVTLEFDINFTSYDLDSRDKFYVWCRSLSGTRHIYFYWIESMSDGYFELRYSDGKNSVLLSYFEESMWHHVKIDVNCSAGSYDIQINGEDNFTNNKFAYSNTDHIASFEFCTSKGTVAEYVYLDNFIFTHNGTEFVSDGFEEDEIGKYPGGGGLGQDHYLHVQYQNVSEDSYIDRIVFTQSGYPLLDNGEDIEFAVYDTEIKNGTFVNITEANLTSGSFQDLNESTWYFIKIYLVSNGTETCNVGALGSDVMFRNISSYSREEDDGYFGPIWGGSSVPPFQQPWYNQILAMLEANTGLLLAGILFLLALILISGGKRGRR